jgi:hypothetical protein
VHVGHDRSRHLISERHALPGAAEAHRWRRHWGSHSGQLP